MKININSGFLSIFFFFSCPALSEVTLDGSLGVTGTLSGPDFEITENHGKRAGNNLFHSFGRFNLKNTESATFSGSEDINNVIGRVTGGQTSSIDGTLRVTIPNANLYLLNPAGIIFKKNAKLDVPGSFHVSTADYLKFQDGVILNSNSISENPVLTTAAPAAFGFLKENAASISLSGGNNTLLEVPNNKTLLLVGGDITIEDSSLYAPGGEVNLASVNSVGEVKITQSQLDTASFTRMGNIKISQNPVISRTTNSQNKLLANVDASADTAGNVFIRGGQMVMDNAYIESNTINGDGGGIDISLKSGLNIDGIAKSPESELTHESGIITFTQGKGKAGNIVLDVNDQVKLTQATRIHSVSNSLGNGGDITIKANTIILEGNESTAVPRLITNSTGSGNAGNITVSAADKLEVSDGAIILSQSTANGSTGNLSLSASHSIDIHDGRAGFLNDANGNGSLGNIDINTETLDLHDGAIVSVSSTTGKTTKGKSGRLTINATKAVNLNNDSNIDSRTKGIVQGADLSINTGNLRVTESSDIETSTSSSGNGGELTINTGVLKVTESSEIRTLTSSSGNGGELTIKTNHLDTSNGASISSITSSAATGIGGDIDIEATGDISLKGPQGGIASYTLGKANSGNITIKSKKLDVQNGAWVNTTTTNSGRSGDLSIDSNEIVLTNDMIAASSEDILTGISVWIYDRGKDGTAVGNSGNLTVKADNLTVSNGARIRTLNLGQGKSGDLLVNANKILLTNDFSASPIRSEILATSFDNESGIPPGSSGNLTINADELIVENGTEISTSNFSTGNSGNLEVNSKNIVLSRNGDSNRTGVFNTNFGSGKLGTLTVNTENLQIQQGAAINAATNNTGNGGKLDINSQSIYLSGNGTEISTVTLSKTGNAGELSIMTDNLEVYDGATINSSTYGFGLGGNLNVNAQSIVLSGKGSGLISSSNITSTRNAGNLTVTSDSLDIRDGARIDTRTSNQGVSVLANIITLDSEGLTNTPVEDEQKNIGNGGDLTLNVAHLKIHTNAVITASTFGDGDSGNLTVNSQTIDINGIQSTEFTGISSQANPESIGSAGDLVIRTDSLKIRNNGRVSASTFGTGHAGNLIVEANDILLHNAILQSASSLENIDTSENPDIAMSGDVTITVNNRLQLDNKGAISVRTEKANAGMITINGAGILKLSENSKIVTSVADGKGKGGNISLNTPLVSLDFSSIKAQAVEGEGGNIIISGLFFESPFSVVSATSKLSMDGVLKFKPDTTISGSIAELPETLMDSSSKLTENCATQSESSFVVKASDGGAYRPGDLIPSNFIYYTALDKSILPKKLVSRHAKAVECIK